MELFRVLSFRDAKGFMGFSIAAFMMLTSFSVFADETGEEHGHGEITTDQDTDTQQHLKDVESMLELMGVPEQVRNSAGEVLKLYSAKLDPDNDDENVKKLVEAYQRTVEGVVNQVLDWSSLKTTYIASYASLLNAEEVAAISAFFLSPAGQKYTVAQQQATSDIQQTTQHLVEADLAPAITKLASQLRAGLSQLHKAKQNNDAN